MLIIVVADTTNVQTSETEVSQTNTTPTVVKSAHDKIKFEPEISKTTMLDTVRHIINHPLVKKVSSHFNKAGDKVADFSLHVKNVFVKHHSLNSTVSNSTESTAMTKNPGNTVMFYVFFGVFALVCVGYFCGNMCNCRKRFWDRRGSEPLFEGESINLAC